MKKIVIIILSVLALNQANATIYTVTTAADNAFGTNPAANAGTGTLRQAIVDANAHAGKDTIVFAITGGGVKTLLFSISLLPVITSPVYINGYSQPGSSMGTLGSRTVMIEIDGGGLLVTSGGGRSAGSNNGFFRFTSASSSSSISGISIYNTGTAIEALLIEPGASDIHIWGNYIGVLASGVSPSSAKYIHGDAIRLFASGMSTGSFTNINIGTNGDGLNDASEGNVIANAAEAFNGGDGIQVGGSTFTYTYTNVKISGNYIGIAANGTTAAGNGVSSPGISLSNGGTGINMINASNIVIGSNGDNVSDVPEKNIISGNYENGINIRGGSNISIAGNYIGTNKDGTSAVPNARNSDSNIGFAGIFVTGGSSNIIIGFNDATHITSADANVRNIVSGNKGAGIDIYNNPSATGNRIAGNYIGTDVTGNTRLGNGQGNTPAASNIFAAAIDIYNSINTLIGTDGDGDDDTLERNIICGSFQGFGISMNNGAASNTVSGNYVGVGTNGTTAIGNDWSGISLNGANNNTRIGSDGNGVSDTNEKNIISGNLENGIYLTGANTISIAGNYIGTDKNGTTGVSNGRNSDSNTGFAGIFVTGGSSNIIIGFNDAIHIASAATDVRNIVSGNKSGGIDFYNNPSAVGNRISGNYIGVDATGNTRLGNGQGNTPATANIFAAAADVYNSINTLIGTDSDGDDDAAERNIICGSYEGFGIAVSNSSASNIIAGNYIGIGTNGTTAIGNAWSGISIDVSNNNRIGSNDDGTNDAIEANIIANNAFSTLIASSDGIRITGNSTGNRLSRNSFYNNKSTAIDLANNGITLNDGSTTSGQPNVLLDYPVITFASISGSNISVTGYVSTCGGAETTAGPNIAGSKTIQFYKEANDGDQNGALTNGSCTRSVSHGEGIQYLGSVTGVVNTFSTSFTLVAGATLTTSDKITAIAIDANGNTSEFGVATIAAILPVQLLRFTVAQKGNTAVLNWSTATESNNLGFDIERSADGIHFSKMGFVGSAATGGNSTTLLHYTSTDAQPLDGINYYRLKQTDFDGKINYSAVATVNFRKGNSISLSAYPNPASSELSITIAGITRFTQANITVYSAVGQVVHKTNITRQTNTINCSQLSEGVYFIVYTDGEGYRMQTKVTKK